jgi:DNA-binding beta-propeller fold protein YncE
MRRHTVIIGVFLLTIGGAATQSQAPVYPELIHLPAGFGPEGIAVGKGPTFYVGAGLGSNAAVLGQILIGDLRTGDVSQLVAPTGKTALGMKFDARSNLLYVAGGPSGTGSVYDAASGAEVGVYQFRPPSSFPPPPPPTTFINDVIVTRDAAYFTDSVVPVLYRVALGRRGEPSDQFDEIPLPADVFGAGPSPRANGIAADPSGKYLIVDHTTAGQLYRIDTATYTAVRIDLTGGDVLNADGLLLDGKTLYVVQNANNRVAVVELSPDFLSGAIVRYVAQPFASNPATKVPTTIAEFGNSLYAVTAGSAPPAPDFVVRLQK